MSGVYMLSDNDRMYLEYRLPIARYLRRKVAAEEIEDLVQETFERFFREKGAGRLPAAAGLPWLFRVARNLACDLYRRNRGTVRNLESFDELPVIGTGPESGLFAEQLRRLMFAVAANLDQDGRYARLLALLLDGRESQAGIAEQLNCSERTVRRMTGSLMNAIAGECKKNGITAEYLAE